MQSYETRMKLLCQTHLGQDFIHCNPNDVIQLLSALGKLQPVAQLVYKRLQYCMGACVSSIFAVMGRFGNDGHKTFDSVSFPP